MPSETVGKFSILCRLAHTPDLHGKFLLSQEIVRLKFSVLKSVMIKINRIYLNMTMTTGCHVSHDFCVFQAELLLENVLRKGDTGGRKGQ